MTLAWIVVTTVLISLISLIGVFALAVKGKILDRITYYLVALSAGSLMAGAFLHLLPETAEKFEDFNYYPTVIASFIIFYLVEKVFYWHHCHEGECPVHIFGYINLIGDFIHNFIDGLIVAASFMVDLRLGIVTAFVIVLHEIPQEIGDFGVLVYAGFKKSTALMINFFTALAAVLGGFLGYYLFGVIDISLRFLLPLAAGSFIYIAASDLIPEIKKETHLGKSLISFLVFIFGILIIYGLRFVGE